MADLARLNVEVKDQGVDKVEQRLGRVDKGFGRIQQQVIALNQGLELIGRASRFVGRVGSSFLDASAQVEAMQVRLVGLTGDEQSAAAEYERLAQIASSTPFELSEVVEAGITVRAFGDQNDAAAIAVADLAAFMGTDAVTAAGAYGRAFAGGAGAADILRERGVLAMVRLREGVDDLSRLSLPQFRRALFEAMTDPAGRIAGSTDRLSRSWVGLTSNVTDAFFQLQAQAGGIITRSDAMRRGVLQVTGGIRGLADRIGDWAEQNQDIIDQRIDEVFQSILDAAEDLPETLGRIASAGGRVASSFGDIAGGFGKVGSAFLGLPGPVQEILALALVGGAAGGARGAAIGAGVGGLLVLEDLSEQLQQAGRAADEIQIDDSALFDPLEKADQAIRDVLDTWALWTQGIVETFPPLEGLLALLRGIEGVINDELLVPLGLVDSEIQKITARLQRELRTIDTTAVLPLTGADPTQTLLVFDELGNVIGVITAESEQFKQKIEGVALAAEVTKEELKEAQRILQAIQTPAEEFANFVDVLTRLRDRGAFVAAGAESDQEAFTAALQQTVLETLELDDVTDNYNQTLADQQEQVEAIRQSFRQWGESIDTTAERMRQSVRPAEELRDRLEEIRKTAALRPDVLTPDVVEDLRRRAAIEVGGLEDDTIDALANIENAVERVGASVSDALVDAFVDGRGDIQDVLKGLAEDLLRFGVQEFFVEPIFGGLRRGIAGIREGRNVDRALTEAEQVDAIADQFRDAAEDTEINFSTMIVDVGDQFAQMIFATGDLFDTIFSNLLNAFTGGGGSNNILESIFGGIINGVSGFLFGGGGPGGAIPGGGGLQSAGPFGSPIPGASAQLQAPIIFNENVTVVNPDPNAAAQMVRDQLPMIRADFVQQVRRGDFALTKALGLRG